MNQNLTNESLEICLAPNDTQLKEKSEQKNLTTQLLSNKNSESHHELKWHQKLYQCIFGVKISEEHRVINIDGTVQPPNYFPNIIKNQKYSVLTIIPIVLYNEFKYFFNLFFLLIAISQFIPVFQVGLLFTYVAPLVLVLSLTILKEAYDDYKRYQRDKEANSQQYTTLNKQGQQIKLKSSELKVGNIVQVLAGQRIPADMVLLSSNDVSGDVFLKTDQLDGETDWKLRKPVLRTQNLFHQKGGIEAIYESKGEFQIGAPIENIYKFQGLYVSKDENANIKEPLSLENTLWSNTVLASGKIWAMVIYTGKETRVAMNSKSAVCKFGQLDSEINYISKLLFVFMMIISIILVFLRGIQTELSMVVLVFRYMLLLSSIIPISMRVNLDFAKLIYCYKINVDSQIPGTVARSSQIPEELGRIQFLLTDKTGTLTQNDMIFKKIALEQGVYTEEEISFISNVVKEQCEKSLGPMEDIQQFHIKSQNENQLSINNDKQLNKMKSIRRDKDTILRDLITALALCHNVVPIYEEGKPKDYQASSPDEVALVKIAENMGISLEKRTQEQITIKNANQQLENYKVLANFPFSSETKRMGILLKQLETNRYIFYLKGADTIMKSKIPEYQRGFLLDESENLSSEGLRTLVITQKYLSEEEYNQWSAQYDEARASIVQRDEKIQEVLAIIEKNMEFLGITGVEDKLQEDICNTLESLRNAGIKIWMLTGDKIETAICVAISSGLKSQQQNKFVIKEMEDQLHLQHEIQRFSTFNNSILIIDGTSLKLALEHHEELFFRATQNAPAVVCCRCSPTQKSDIVKCIKKYTRQKTAAIGDGGNDVAMIQSADVGIGIVGKEGMQAALAADFSILQFKNLNRLLLWHGRQSYKRSSVLSQFVIHRGLIISIIQAIFIICFFFVPIPIYNGILMLGYSTIFTMFPVFSLIFDEDVDELTAMNYPPLYKSLQKNRELSTKTFLGWLFISIFQGAAIMVLSFIIFNDAFISIQTITYTALIILEILNILTSIHKIHIVMIISIISSIGIYSLTLLYLKNYIIISDWDTDFFLKLCIIVGVCWFPPFIFKVIKKRIDPNDFEKIMKNKKNNFKINFKIK